MRLSGGGAILAVLPVFLTGLVVASVSGSDGVASPPSHGKPCVEPEVRREWRALSEKEKAEWISAVKVNSR